MLTLTPRFDAGGFEGVDDDEARGLRGTPPKCVTLRPSDRRLILRWSVAGVAVGFVPFLLTLWDWGLRPLRTAGAHQFASNVYDLQARAFLDGDLAVPTDSLGIEGFVIDGRTYMYFPPFPAFLRVPVLMLTDRFDGRLTTVSMLLAWTVLAVATAALFWCVRILVRPDSVVSRVEGVAAAIFTASVTGGSVIVFDAALPWVYHEVYVWASAFAVAALAGLASLARRPRGWVVTLTVVCVIGAILTRTTTGWALAFTVIAAGVIMTFRSRSTRRHGAGLIVGGFIALAAGVAFNWAKFRHPFMFPLEHQIWTAENSRRRLALLMNDGSITGPQFFRSSLVNYFRPDGIRFVSHFPFITLPAEPARSYGGAFLDQSYRTGSVPAFMPLLFAATLWGFVATALTRPWHRLVSLLVPLLGAMLICAGVMGYGYLANRYTSEFVPILAIGAAIGIVDVARRVEGRPRWIRAAVAGTAASLLLFGIVANTAVGLATSRLTWRGQRLVAYIETQRRLGDWFGESARPPLTWSDALPARAPADTLHIVGDCDALYVATGDQYEPWVLVEARSLTAEVSVNGERTRPGIARLFSIEGARTRNVTLETSGNNRFRLRIGEGWIYLPTDWYEFQPGERVTVTVTADTERDRYRISVSDRSDEFAAAAEWDATWKHVVARAGFAVPPVEFLSRLGVSVDQSRGRAPELCAELLDDVRN